MKKDPKLIAKMDNLVKSLTKEELQADIKAAFQSMHEQGMHMDMLKEILKVAKPIGDFEALRRRYKLTREEFEILFSGIARKFGIDLKAVPDGDGYGASGLSTMLGWNPHPKQDPTTFAKKMRGEISEDDEEEDPVRDMIFFSGHEAEKLLRTYFQELYKDRYLVIECDLQWHSRFWKHFLGNVDGFVIDLETGDLGILEIKHTDYMVRGGNSAKEGFTNSEGRYDTTEECFWGNKSTRCYAMQGDGYLGMFKGVAKFVCYFMGWGLRCNHDSTAMVRIDLDEDRTEAMLDEAESFIDTYVIGGIDPDYKMIKESGQYYEVVKELFKDVDPYENSVTFDPSLEPVAIAIAEAKEKLDKKHEEIKKLQEEEKELQRAYEEYQAPFIEALGTHPKGYMKIGDTRIYIDFNVPNGVDEEKLRREYPAEAKDCETVKVSATKLKKKYGKAYNDCYGPKLGAARRWSMSVYKDKK